MPLATLDAPAEELREDGQTVMFVAVDGRPAGVIGVADPIKAVEQRKRFRRCTAEGIAHRNAYRRQPRTAEAVARKLGIDEVHAEVLPEQKVRRGQEASGEGRMVAMAGDGVNDAPALAAGPRGHRHGNRY